MTTSKKLDRMISTLDRVAATKRVAAKSVSDDFIAELTANTNDNLHSENLLLIAKWVGERRLINALQSFITLHHFYGSIDKELRPLQVDLARRVMRAAEQTATAEAYQRIHDAL